MIRILLKKQFAEMFRTYLYDAKKNKKRSKAAIILYFILFVLLMVGVLGGLFTGLAVALCASLLEVDMGWLYFSILGLLAVFLGTFGSVFNTYAGLYLAKDNDLLLSMPIPIKSLMAARLLGVYLMGLMYSAVVSIPAVVVYQVVSPSITVLAASLLWIFIISVIVLTLSLALGYVVAKVSQKLKNKSFITVLISLVFLVAYYVIYYMASDLIKDLLENAAFYGANVKAYAYALYVFGQSALGDGFSIVLTVVVVGLVLAFFWRLLAHNFLTLATSGTASVKVRYVERKTGRKSVFLALFAKEMKRFTATPIYMLNCGLGILLLPVLGIALLVKSEMLEILTSEAFIGQLSPILCCAAVCLAAGMNNMAVPSVSLEGKNLWLLQSLPVLPIKVLQAKLSVQMVLTGIPTIFCGVCVAIALKADILTGFLLILTALAVMTVMALIDLICGLLMPNLIWTNEVTPVKQSGSVLLSLLLHFIVVVVPTLLFALSPLKGIGTPLNFALWIGICLVVGAWLYLWLAKTGAKRFAAL